jgi:signal peptidase I
MRDPGAPSQDGASSLPERPPDPARAKGAVRLPEPETSAENPRPAGVRRAVAGAKRSAGLIDRLRGLWRVTVADGSMMPAVLPGDWLLVDPTVHRWPRRGSIVVFHEPETDILAIKRVAARPGDWVPFADGWLQLADDEAWLLGDATDDSLAAAGLGGASDSRRYGPVPVEALVGRAWFRYGPARRMGRPAPAPADILERGRQGAIPDLTGPARPQDRGQPAG